MILPAVCDVLLACVLVDEGIDASVCVCVWFENKNKKNKNPIFLKKRNQINK